jgi:hypothetical protein
MKILVLVLSYNDGDVYDKFYDTQLKTWFTEKVEGVDTFFYFGKTIINEHFFYDGLDKIVGNKIMINVDESYHCGIKTLRAFDIIKNFDFDYIFRTNSSSYIDKKLLLDSVKNAPTTNYYSGVLGNNKIFDFALGCGYFLSKDLVHLTLEQSTKWDHSMVDDLAIAKLMLNNNIFPLNNKRIDLLDFYDIHNTPMDYFHYRFKSMDRNLDIQNMYKIHNMKTNQ